MVPYPAGGPLDAVARSFFNPLGKALGQPVIVENLGGVSGASAAQMVLAAPVDGGYLFQGSPNEVILSRLANAAVKRKTEGVRLVHPVAEAVMVFVTRKDLTVNYLGRTHRAGAPVWPRRCVHCWPRSPRSLRCP